MADVFISYSREDLEFVQRLDLLLRGRGRKTWVDWEGVRPAEVFMDAIYAAIESAQAFVFVISPASVASLNCQRELARALECNKRLIPVVWRKVPAENVPPSLKALDWISFIENRRFLQSFDSLISALDTDLAWIRFHTRLLVRALDWKERGRNASLLLRGDDLSAANQALSKSAGRQPPLNDLQYRYVSASRIEVRRNQLQQEVAARLSGEVEAAGRIQMGTLPTPGAAFPGETRFDIYAYLEPARSMGGDLYDFFWLDSHRLLFLIGDVSGKGVPASLLMAVSKAFFKSIALRHPDEIAAITRSVNSEISRDNPEGLFVGLFAGILNARTGQLDYCNAGFDAPYLVHAGKRPPRQLMAGGGPPLCVLDDFPYESAIYLMKPGEMICLVTDGVTEALDAAGALYGPARLKALLADVRPSDAGKVGAAIRDDVTRFTEGTERSDDQTILVVRWNGSIS
jgi:serine phosphatase RsbU (regulator of sigma subunit)